MLFAKTPGFANTLLPPAASEGALLIQQPRARWRVENGSICKQSCVGTRIMLSFPSNQSSGENMGSSVNIVLTPSQPGTHFPRSAGCQCPHMTAQPDYDDTNAQHCDTTNTPRQFILKACCFFVSFGPNFRTASEYFNFSFACA